MPKQLSLLEGQRIPSRIHLHKYPINARQRATFALVDAISEGSCTLAEKMVLYKKVQELIFACVDEGNNDG